MFGNDGQFAQLVMDGLLTKTGTTVIDDAKKERSLRRWINIEVMNGKIIRVYSAMYGCINGSL